MSNKNTIIYTIDQKQKDLRKAYIDKDWEKVKELEKELLFFEYGIK